MSQRAAELQGPGSGLNKPQWAAIESFAATDTLASNAIPFVCGPDAPAGRTVDAFKWCTLKNSLRTCALSAAHSVLVFGRSRFHLTQKLSLPHSRPMPSIGSGCHELRIRDRGAVWRIFYFIDADAIVLLAITDKTTRQTPQRALDNCKRRLKDYKSSR